MAPDREIRDLIREGAEFEYDSGGSAMAMNDAHRGIMVGATALFAAYRVEVLDGLRRLATITRLEHENQRLYEVLRTILETDPESVEMVDVVDDARTLLSLADAKSGDHDA